MIDPSRRSFLIGGLAALITAPAIVRAASLMPVKKIIESNIYSYEWLHQEISLGYAITRKALDDELYGRMMLLRQQEAIAESYEALRHYTVTPRSISALVRCNEDR